MINTKVVDITQDLLLKFAFDHLKRVAHAYFGLHIRKKVDNARDKINRDIQILKR